jgi:hypothetical protein
MRAGWERLDQPGRSLLISILRPQKLLRRPTLGAERLPRDAFKRPCLLFNGRGGAEVGRARLTRREGSGFYGDGRAGHQAGNGPDDRAYDPSS